MISPNKKISGLARPEPAPQYHLAQESECFLTSLADKVNQLAAYTGSDSPVPHEVYEADVARTQRFIKFMLTTDYDIKLAKPIKLNKADRVHFHGLHKALGDLSKVWPSRRPSNPKRHPLAAYFWQYVHLPAINLGICTEVIIAMVYRFVRYSTSQGIYKGCTTGLARNEGLAVLAQKIYIDRILLFQVAADGNRDMLSKLTAAADKITALYFDSIHPPTQGTRGIQHLWSNTKRLSFDPNERGKMYQRRRFNATVSKQYLLKLWYHEQQDWWSLRRQQQVEISIKAKQPVKDADNFEALLLKA